MADGYDGRKRIDADKNAAAFPNSPVLAPIFLRRRFARDDVLSTGKSCRGVAERTVCGTSSVRLGGVTSPALRFVGHPRPFERIVRPARVTVGACGRYGRMEPGEGHRLVSERRTEPCVNPVAHCAVRAGPAVKRRRGRGCEIRLVAGYALIRGVSVSSILMTPVARDHTVPPLQPESGHGVVEQLGIPVFRGVAVPALRRPELVKMRVCVAFGALRPETGKLPFFLVAFAAGYLGVPAVQLESGDVVEKAVRLPCLGVMTLLAFLPHFPLMRLVVVLFMTA